MEIKNNRVTMIPLNACTAVLSGDSRQNLSISLNNHAKGCKTGLFDADSSGDSRHEVCKGNYMFQSNIVSDSCFAFVNVLSSGDSRQDFNIFTD